MHVQAGPLESQSRAAEACIKAEERVGKSKNSQINHREEAGQWILIGWN